MPFGITAVRVGSAFMPELRIPLEDSLPSLLGVEGPSATGPSSGSGIGKAVATVGQPYAILEFGTAEVPITPYGRPPFPWGLVAILVLAAWRLRVI